MFLLHGITRIGYGMICWIDNTISLSRIRQFLGEGGRLFKKILHILKQPISGHLGSAEKLRQSLKSAKSEKGFRKIHKIFFALISYLFGTYSVFSSIVNYTLPLLALAVSLRVVYYVTSLDYALEVTYNGHVLGYVESEDDYYLANSIVKERISGVESYGKYMITPNYTLVTSEQKYELSSATELADEILLCTTLSLDTAYGVYIDNTFFCAVDSIDSVQSALSDNLEDFEAVPNAMDIRYQNAITYQEGIYVTDSIQTPQQTIKKLLSSKQTEKSYVTKSYDTVFSVARYFSLSSEELLEYYPELETELKEGMRISVPITERYLPIVYEVEQHIVSYLPFDIQEVETTALNVGCTKILSKGEYGEKESNVLVTYVNGMESERNVISSVILKEPVTEQLGIGTYEAKPLLSTTILRGSGLMSWPVNGGYISDYFISDRNHKGMDIAAPAGTEIYAALDGTVIESGWNAGGYGYRVILEHENGLVTIYGHCSMTIATVGQTVTKGQLIALVGTTGMSTGNHCHFEVRQNGVLMDPAGFLRVNAD